MEWTSHVDNDGDLNWTTDANGIRYTLFAANEWHLAYLADNKIDIEIVNLSTTDLNLAQRQAAQIIR